MNVCVCTGFKNLAIRAPLRTTRRHAAIHDGSVADSVVDADVDRWSYGRRSTDPLFRRRRPHVRWEPDSPTARNCSGSRQTVSSTVMPEDQLYEYSGDWDRICYDGGPASR